MSESALTKAGHPFLLTFIHSLEHDMEGGIKVVQQMISGILESDLFVEAAGRMLIDVYPREICFGASRINGTSARKTGHLEMCDIQDILTRAGRKVCSVPGPRLGIAHRVSRRACREQLGETHGYREIGMLASIHLLQYGPARVW